LQYQCCMAFFTPLIECVKPFNQEGMFSALWRPMVSLREIDPYHENSGNTYKGRFITPVICKIYSKIITPNTSAMIFPAMPLPFATYPQFGQGSVMLLTGRWHLPHRSISLPPFPKYNFYIFSIMKNSIAFEHSLIRRLINTFA
jgi:hypothetical protein